MKKNILLIFFPILSLSQIFYSPRVDLIQQNQQTNSLKNYRDHANCICDLTFNVCNNLCCCDPDCLSTLVDEWRSQSVCTLESEESPKILEFPRCIRWQKNPRDKYLFMNRINHITCIVYESVPYLGYFYNERTNSSAYQYNQDEQLPSKLYQDIDLVKLTGKGYNPNTPIFVKINQGYGKALSYFVLPSQDIFGMCNGAKQIIFQQDFSSECVRKFYLTSDDCSSFSYISSERYKTMSFLTNSEQTSDLASSSFTISNAQNIEWVENSGICSCNNVLRQTNFEITLDGNKISKATIAFTYQNYTGFCGSSQSIKQQYSLAYVIANESPTFQIPKSGTPGYLFNKPLIIGVLGTKSIDGADRKVIYRPKKGFSINIADSAGRCILTSNSASATNDENRQIKFGSDFDTSCTIEMSYSEFQSNCNNANFYSAYHVYNIFKEDEIFIGKFGIADYHKLLDWVPVKMTSSIFQVDANNNQYSIKCPKIPPSTVITIFYSESGAIGNDQLYILDVQKSYPSNTIWKWLKSTSETQKFTVSFKVIFVDVKYYEIQSELMGPPDKIKQAINYLFSPFKSQDSSIQAFQIVLLLLAMLLIQLI